MGKASYQEFIICDKKKREKKIPPVSEDPNLMKPAGTDILISSKRGAKTL
jgi:hypothetical protein